VNGWFKTESNRSTNVRAQKRTAFSADPAGSTATEFENGKLGKVGSIL
jgi:hypothetical protein